MFYLVSKEIMYLFLSWQSDPKCPMVQLGQRETCPLFLGQFAIALEINERRRCCVRHQNRELKLIRLIWNSFGSKAILLTRDEQTHPFLPDHISWQIQESRIEN